MPEWRSIVVPLDGSMVAEGALPLGAEIARRAGALLHLVHVRAPAGITVPAAPADVLLEEQPAYLSHEAERYGTGSPLCMTAALSEPDAVGALTAYASASQCDLVVLATHGHGALGRAWIGSMADQLVTALPMPLLIVRPADHPAATRERLRNVAVLLDGSERAEAILDPVTRLGALFDARYALIRVSPDTPRHGPGEARLYLEEVATVLRGRGLETATLVLPGWDVAAAVADFAWGAGADLIAVATHGRAGSARALRGSVAQELLRLGPAPLLTLLAPGD